MALKHKCYDLCNMIRDKFKKCNIKQYFNAHNQVKKKNLQKLYCKNGVKSI